jgi:hypothetical protein
MMIYVYIYIRVYKCINVNNPRLNFHLILMEVRYVLNATQKQFVYHVCNDNNDDNDDDLCICIYMRVYKCINVNNPRLNFHLILMESDMY